MTKREICDAHRTIAYYSGLGGLEARYIEYGIDDFIYLVAGTWSSSKSYHKLKVHYGGKYDYIICMAAVAGFRTLSRSENIRGKSL